RAVRTRPSFTIARAMPGTRPLDTMAWAMASNRATSKSAGSGGPSGAGRLATDAEAAGTGVAAGAATGEAVSTIARRGAGAWSAAFWAVLATASGINIAIRASRGFRQR